MRSWDKPGGHLFTAPAASGVKRAQGVGKVILDGGPGGRGSAKSFGMAW